MNATESERRWLLYPGARRGVLGPSVEVVTEVMHVGEVAGAGRTIPPQPGYDLSIQINVERKGESYGVRCHGANGTLTIGPVSSLSAALDEVAGWAKRQADWNGGQGR